METDLNFISARTNHYYTFVRQLVIVFLLVFSSQVMRSQNTVVCTGFRTYTIGGWGSNCNGNNPGCYLRDHFNAVFGTQGLVIGCDNALVLTTDVAVNNFLPSGSTPQGLPLGTLTDPGSGYSNVLAAQLVAITLAVRFDAADPLFSTNPQLLSDLIIVSGPFQGNTVGEFLALANEAIGGCSTATNYSELNETATLINQNFDNGTVDHGFLSCIVPLTVSLVQKHEIICYGDGSGEIQAVVHGGAEPYTYLWSNGGVGSLITGVTAGTYSLTVSDQTGQTITSTITLNQPDLLVINLSGENLRCFDDSSGSIQASVTGGSTPYELYWNNGDQGTYTNHLPIGNYTLYVICANGCEGQAELTITQPDPITTISQQTNVNCHGDLSGEIILTVSGGTLPYHINWNNGDSGSDIANLPAGNYQADIVDNNGCKATAFDTITEPALLSATITTEHVKCFGEQTGNNSCNSKQNSPKRRCV